MSHQLATRILCYVASGEGRSDAVERAITLARRTNGSITLLGVIEPMPGLLTSLVPSARQLGTVLTAQLETELEALATELRAEGLEVEQRIRHGQTAEEITQQVVDGRHDLVIKVARGQDGRMLGLTARRLLRSCPAAVWVVNPGPHPRRRVAVALDPQGDFDLQQRLLDTAREIARMLGAQLDVLHAWEVQAGHLLASRMQPEDYKRLLEGVGSEARGRLDDFLSKTPGAADDERVRLLEGHHGPELLRYLSAEHVDLLVMGTVSRTGLAGVVIGNTAERLLSQIECSVLVLKPGSVQARPDESQESD